LMCVYPAPDLATAKKMDSLNYTLPSPAASAPPGTTEVLPEQAQGRES
jgi:hypothetical protein